MPVVLNSSFIQSPTLSVLCLHFGLVAGLWAWGQRTQLTGPSQVHLHLQSLWKVMGSGFIVPAGEGGQKDELVGRGALRSWAHPTYSSGRRLGLEHLPGAKGGVTLSRTFLKLMASGLDMMAEVPRPQTSWIIVILTGFPCKSWCKSINMYNIVLFSRSLTLLLREILSGSVFLPSLDFLADPVRCKKIFFFNCDKMHIK